MQDENHVSIILGVNFEGVAVLQNGVILNKLLWWGPWSLNCIMSRAKVFLDFQLFLYYIYVINNILLFWTSSLIPFVIPLQPKTWKNNFKHQFKYLFPGFSMPFQLFPRIFSSVCFSPYFQYLPYNHNIVVCLSGSMFTRWKRKLPWFSLAWS